MDTIEQSVLRALDGGENAGLFPFLPYILQDLWEMGTDPRIVIDLIRKHLKSRPRLKLLDLGCGKGPVSVQAAKALGCECLGLDAVEDFLAFARVKAEEYGVERLCRFEKDDIRTRAASLRGYDAIVLGAIGPVFGDYCATLSALTPCLTEKGIIVIDDGYIRDDDAYARPGILKKRDILAQIAQAGMKLLDEVIVGKDEIEDSDDFIFAAIKKRCDELIEKYPEQRRLFEGYVRKQAEENEVLETKIICSVMVIGREEFA